MAVVPSFNSGHFYKYASKIFSDDNSTNTDRKRVQRSSPLDSFDQEEPSDVDDELLKVVPEPDAVEPVRGQGQVACQLVEGVGQPLLVDGVRLAGDQVRHELVVGGLGRGNNQFNFMFTIFRMLSYLVAGDEDVERAAGDWQEVGIDLLGQDEIEDDLKGREGKQRHVIRQY